MSPDRVPKILLVEDNPGDVRLVREALVAYPHPVSLAAAKGVDAALGRLRPGLDGAEPAPDLILLDLNLPGRGGLEFLGEVKADPALRGLPVVVWTSSEADGDVREARRLGADGYAAKPAHLDEYLDAIHSLCLTWLQGAHPGAEHGDE